MPCVEFKANIASHGLPYLPYLKKYRTPLLGTIPSEVDEAKSENQCSVKNIYFHCFRKPYDIDSIPSKNFSPVGTHPFLHWLNPTCRISDPTKVKAINKQRNSETLGPL